MKSEEAHAGKELYRQMRGLSWDRLWNEEVPRFDAAHSRDRVSRVGVIRAVGVVFSESGPREHADDVRSWLRNLLKDPEEKVRRYAMAALPKVGAGHEEEAEMLSLLRSTGNQREVKFLAGALDKIGGEQTLAATRGLLPQTEQKTRAAIARSENPGVVRMDRVLEDVDGIRIHLRGRRGLEELVQSEVEAFSGRFRVIDRSDGMVAIEPTGPFSLDDLYTLRCFGTAGFCLGTTQSRVETLASLITSPLARRLMQSLTEGAVRYRLDFVSKGHQRSMVRELANRVYAVCPEILNDARSALWAVDIHSTGRGEMVELRPRLVPDPRFAYRRQDVPAASHPPLAACMAWLAGLKKDETVWDPFCGSGVELVECALRGGVSALYGTDRSSEAVAIAQGNLSATALADVKAKWLCCDFRDHLAAGGPGPSSLSLIITNPPLGMRVPIPNLRQLVADLFSVAATTLKPGGRLVFINPLRLENPHPLLEMKFQRLVDMSGFDCRLEMYVKVKS